MNQNRDPVIARSNAKPSTKRITCIRHIMWAIYEQKWCAQTCQERIGVASITNTCVLQPWHERFKADCPICIIVTRFTV